MKKKLFRILIPLALLGAVIGGICWFAPQSAVGKFIIGATMSAIDPKEEKMENLKTDISISALVLQKDYATDEKVGDTKYLNKVIEVSGSVGETEKNQEGGLMVVFATDDPMAGVQCAMRDKNVTVNKDQSVTIKGRCSGISLTGVALRGCIIK